MSAKAATAAGFWQRAFEHPQDLRTIRYAVGATLAVAIAMGYQWELSYLVPVLSLGFFANPATRPDLKAGVAFVGVIGIACWVGLLLGRHLTPYPIIYVLFSGLVLLRLFYAQQSGRSPLLITWLMIAVLVVPMLSIQAAGLANLVAGGLVFGAAVSVLLVWIVYFFIPEPEDFDASAPPPPPAKQLPPAIERFKSAAASTIVVWPVMTFFYMFDKLDSLLILIFIAILAQQPAAFATDFKAGKALIAGNIIGGAIAIVFYELLAIMPEFGFLLLLTLLLGLVLGARVFSGKPKGALFGMAFSTVLLIIGSVTSGEGEAGSKVYTRVFQIIIAVSYVVFAFRFIMRLAQERRTS